MRRPRCPKPKPAEGPDHQIRADLSRPLSKYRLGNKQAPFPHTTFSQFRNPAHQPLEFKPLYRPPDPRQASLLSTPSHSRDIAPKSPTTTLHIIAPNALLDIEPTRRTPRHHKADESLRTLNIDRSLVVELSTGILVMPRKAVAEASLGAAFPARDDGVAGVEVGAAGIAGQVETPTPQRVRFGSAAVTAGEAGVPGGRVRLLSVGRGVV